MPNYVETAECDTATFGVSYFVTVDHCFLLVTCGRETCEQSSKPPSVVPLRSSVDEVLTIHF